MFYKYTNLLSGAIGIHLDWKPEPPNGQNSPLITSQLTYWAEDEAQITNVIRHQNRPFMIHSERIMRSHKDLSILFSSGAKFD